MVNFALINWRPIRTMSFTQNRAKKNDIVLPNLSNSLFLLSVTSDSSSSIFLGNGFFFVNTKHGKSYLNQSFKLFLGNNLIVTPKYLDNFGIEINVNYYLIGEFKLILRKSVNNIVLE